MLTAAREWGAQPSEMLGCPRGRWSEVDRKLAIALTLHDKDLCPGGCGHYLDETSHQDGWHEVKSLTCGACATRDQYAKDNAERMPGEIRYVVES